MRGDLAGDPTFRELLRNTRDTAFEVYAHQDLPFEMVIESIHPQRNLSYPPIFQDTFQVRNYPLTDIGSRASRSRRSISIPVSRRSI